MWSKYLEREDSKIVGKCTASRQCVIMVCPGWIMELLSSRLICGAAEELADLQPLWLLLHCLRPLLGSVAPHRQGERAHVMSGGQRTSDPQQVSVMTRGSGFTQLH